MQSCLRAMVVLVLQAGAPDSKTTVCSQFANTNSQASGLHMTHVTLCVCVRRPFYLHLHLPWPLPRVKGHSVIER